MVQWGRKYASMQGSVLCQRRQKKGEDLRLLCPEVLPAGKHLDLRLVLPCSIFEHLNNI